MADTIEIIQGTATTVEVAGPTGPQGPAGAAGATGAQGPQGPAGENGTGIELLTTEGDILYQTDEGADRLPIGTAGQVLKVSSGGIPAWGAESGAVSSVAGKTGAVTLDKNDVGLGNVSNTAQVTSVTGTAPIASSGGATPAISISAATTSAAGSMSGADKTKLDGIASSANNYTHPNHSGDVTSVGDGATTIANDAVSNAKLANMATATIKGRATASTGDPEDLTASDVRTLLNTDEVTDTRDPNAHSHTVYGEIQGAITDDPSTAFSDLASGLSVDALDQTGSVAGLLGGGQGVLFAVSDFAASGSITTSGLTQATARILGRTTASTGAVEEIQIGSGLSLSAGELSSTVSAGIPATLLDAKGDLIVGSADNTAARLAVGGTNGHVLTVDSNETLGVKWAAASGGDTVSIEASAADILSVSSGAISADDAGSDKIVYWKDADSKLAYGSVANVGAAAASHTHAASDVTSGTFDNARINFAAPAAIGNTTANTGAFTTLTASTRITAPTGSSTTVADLAITGSANGFSNAQSQMNFIYGSACYFAFTGGIMKLGGQLGFCENAANTGPDAYIFREGANILGQRNGTNAQTFRLFGTYTSTTNYQRMIIRSVRQTLSALSGASATTTGTFIPDGAVVVGVTTRVATALTGATGYQIGDGTDADRWGDITGTAIGTTSDNTNWTAGTIECFTAGGEVTLTANGSNFTAGAIEICVFYIAGQAD